MKHNNTIPTPSVPCAQWAQKLAAAHPDDLSAAERAALDSHIQSCQSCAAVLAEYHKMDAHILALPPVTPLAGLPAALQHIFQEQAGDEQQHAGTATVTPIPFPATTQSTRTTPTSTRTRSKRLIQMASAIAAVLVVGALIASFLILFTVHHNTLVGGNAPSNAGSVIFVASEDDGTVYAVRPSDGALYWQHIIGHKLTGAPVASQDAVFAGSYDGHIYALHRSDGSLSWSSPPIPGGPVQPDFADSAAVYSSSTSAIYALSAHNGKILWSRSLHGCNTCGASFVAVTGGTAYAYLDGLYALRTSEGKVLWHRPEFQFTTRSFVATEGKVYIPAEHDGNIYVLRASDGQSLHTITVQKNEPIEMAAANGVVYIDSAGHDVYALRTSNDSTLWHKQFNDILLGMSAFNDGTLYFSETIVSVSSVQFAGQTPTPDTSPASTDVYALRASDGTQRWHWHPSNVTGGSTNVLAINGTAYLAIGNSLYALQPSDGSQRWVFSASSTLTIPVAG